MNTPRRASPIEQAELAATRVLEAERAARAQVSYSEGEAARRVAQAGASAQALRERTEARIERLTERMTAQAQQRLDRIRTERERVAGETDADAATLSRLEYAIAKLVDEIAGGLVRTPKG